jgi:integrase
MWCIKNPDELSKLEKKEIEQLVQSYCDTYNNQGYSRRTANNVLTVLKSYFEVNGYNGYNILHLEGYYTPKRYKKKPQYVPQKHEIYLMADSAGSLKNRAIILFLYHSGIRNSTLLALRYGDIKDELLQGHDIIHIPIYPEMKKMDYNACKNQLEYYSFISGEAVKTLRLYVHEKIRNYGSIKDESPLFSSDYNQIERQQREEKPLTSRQIQKIVKQAAKNAGIERWNDITPHSLRKAFQTVARSETIDGAHLDSKVQNFFIGHTLDGCQDNYFDSTKIEDLRYQYSTLRFGRVLVEDKFEQLRRVITKEFQGSGIDADELIEEYVARKEKIKNILRK